MILRRFCFQVFYKRTLGSQRYRISEPVVTNCKYAHDAKAQMQYAYHSVAMARIPKEIWVRCSEAASANRRCFHRS